MLASKGGQSRGVREVEEKLRFGGLVGRIFEDGDVAVWMEAVDEA
jgi:hypothetical protein